MKEFPFNFYPFEKEDMLAFLNEKAKAGYLLQSVHFKEQFATFTMNDTTDFIYDITLHQDSGAYFEKYNDDIQEYIDSCALSGWKHLCTKDGVRFFYGKKDTFPLSDPVTDALSMSDKKKEFKAYLHKPLRLYISLLCLILVSYLTLKPAAWEFYHVYVLCTALGIAFICATLYFSNNIVFRLKGIELMVILIFATLLLATFQNLLLTSIFVLICIVTFMYLLRVKQPFLLKNKYTNLVLEIILVILLFSTL